MGTSPTISAVHTLTISDDDGFLHATSGADSGTAQVFTFSGGSVGSYNFYYDDNITIGGAAETIKTFQMTIGGTTRSFVMNDNGSSIAGAGVGVPFTLNTYNNYTNLEYSDLPCFTSGTMIETNRGPIAVEDLAVGDRVKTADRGFQDIRWIGAAKLSRRDLVARRHLFPVAFEPGSLGPNEPNRRMQVSPQHRMLLTGWNVELAFGLSEVFVPAIALVGNPGVTRDETLDGLTYFHMMFDQHEVIFADGIATESFLVGDQIRSEMDRDQLAEIVDIFPEFADASDGPATVPARPILKAYEGKTLTR